MSAKESEEFFRLESIDLGSPEARSLALTIKHQVDVLRAWFRRCAADERSFRELTSRRPTAGEWIHTDFKDRLHERQTYLFGDLEYVLFLLRRLDLHFQGLEKLMGYPQETGEVRDHHKEMFRLATAVRDDIAHQDERLVRSGERIKILGSIEIRPDGIFYLHSARKVGKVDSIQMGAHLSEQVNHFLEDFVDACEAFERSHVPGSRARQEKAALMLERLHEPSRPFRTIIRDGRTVIPCDWELQGCDFASASGLAMKEHVKKVHLPDRNAPPVLVETSLGPKVFHPSDWWS